MSNFLILRRLVNCWQCSQIIHPHTWLVFIAACRLSIISWNNLDFARWKGQLMTTRNNRHNNEYLLRINKNQYERCKQRHFRLAWKGRIQEPFIWLQFRWSMRRLVRIFCFNCLFTAEPMQTKRVPHLVQLSVDKYQSVP